MHRLTKGSLSSRKSHRLVTQRVGRQPAGSGVVGGHIGDAVAAPPAAYVATAAAQMAFTGSTCRACSTATK